MHKLIIALTALSLLSGCAAMPFAIGAAGAVALDESMERKNGGDGLF